MVLVAEAEERVHQQELHEQVDYIDKFDSHVNQVKIIAVSAAERQACPQVDLLESGHVVVLERNGDVNMPSNLLYTGASLLHVYVVKDRRTLAERGYVDSC